VQSNARFTRNLGWGWNCPEGDKFLGGWHPLTLHILPLICVMLDCHLWCVKLPVSQCKSMCFIQYKISCSITSCVILKTLIQLAMDYIFLWYTCLPCGRWIMCNMSYSWTSFAKLESQGQLSLQRFRVSNLIIILSPFFMDFMKTAVKLPYNISLIFPECLTRWVHCSNKTMLIAGVTYCERISYISLYADVHRSYHRW
jgi:hypothetical protein